MNTRRAICRTVFLSRCWNEVRIAASVKPGLISGVSRSGQVHFCSLAHAIMEFVMMRIVTITVVGLALIVLGGDLWFAQAQASQGPGVAPGNASAMTQHAMALVVYGVAGVLIVAGLIGAVRQH
jgi:hypothetical protein